MFDIELADKLSNLNLNQEQAYYSLRFVNESDFITSLPQSSSGFSHFGRVATFTSESSSKNFNTTLNL